MSTLKVNTIRHTGASSDAVTLATDGTCTAKITNNLSNRNLIINGAMQVAQRGNSTSVGTSGYYGPDRFKYAEVSDAVFSISKSTESPDGFSHSYHYDCTTADTSVAATDYVRFLTVLEGQDVQAFAKGTSSAKKGVLSFYVKTNKTGTYSLFYYDSDNSRQFNATYTVSDSNWNRYTIEIPADTTGALTSNNTAAIEIYWHLVAGSNRTTGSLDATWNTYTGTKEAAGHNVNFADSTSNDFYITGIQLEVDSTGSGVATEFEHRSYGYELARCQRYFYMHLNPNHGNNLGNYYTPVCTAYYDASDSAYGVIPFPVTMRTAPDLYKVVGTNYFDLRTGGGSDGCDDVGTNRTSRTAATIYYTGNVSGTAGHGTMMRARTEEGARIGFDAEM